jgi:quercetin dioxygenase-like cupin family protein
MQRGSRNILTNPMLFGVALAALVSGTQPRAEMRSDGAPPSPPESAGGGYVLAAGKGDVIRRKGNTVTVKVDPRTGSPSMAMGTQVLDAGAGIPVHRHENEDEVLYIDDGSAVAVLGEQRNEVKKGDTVFIPHGVWHGVESRGEAVELIWVVTPPGLEGYFRETGAPPGAPAKVLTPAQLADIGRKHGVIFKQ